MRDVNWLRERKYLSIPYRKLDDQGNALGCLLPFYLLYPEAPRFPWPNEDVNLTEQVLKHLKKYCRQVPVEDIQPGDLPAFYMPFNFLHMGIYLGNDEIIHCMTGETMEVCRFSFMAHRKEGVYRWGSYQEEVCGHF